jgi:hypothetical protein
MIGDKIRNVLDAWRAAVVEGDGIPYPMFEAGCIELRDAARMTDQLEGRPVEPRFRVVASSEVSAPVVDLDAFRGQKPRPVDRPRTPGGGGSVA